MIGVVVFFISFLISFIGSAHLRIYVNPNILNILKYSGLSMYNYYMDAGSLGILGCFLGIIVWVAGILGGNVVEVVIGAALFGSCLGICLHPLYLLHIARRKMRERDVSRLQQQTVDLAAKYGGVLPPLHLIKEFGVGIEVAVEILEGFVRHGLAIRIKKPLIGTFYDFPIVRAHMTEIERKIIELLRDEPEGLTIPQMINMTGLSIESLRHTLDRLIADEVIVPLRLEGKYVLRGFTH